MGTNKKGMDNGIHLSKYFGALLVFKRVLPLFMIGLHDTCYTHMSFKGTKRGS